MKTTVDVDRKLAHEAAAVLGTKSLKDTVNAALSEVVRADVRREFAQAILAGTRSVPTPEEVVRSKAPRVPIDPLQPAAEA